MKYDASTCSETTTIVEVARYNEALMVIARGRLDNGRPISGRRAQEIARATLGELGFDWSFEPIRPQTLKGTTNEV